MSSSLFHCSCQLHIRSLTAKKVGFLPPEQQVALSHPPEKGCTPTASCWVLGQGKSLVAGKGLLLQAVDGLGKFFWEYARNSVGLLASEELFCKGSSCSCC